MHGQAHISPNHKWIACNADDMNVVIAEGKDPEEVSRIAEESGHRFIISFVPDENFFYVLSHSQ